MSMSINRQKSTYNSSLYTPAAKRDRFVRIAEKRTNRILDNLRLLGNTSNKSLYSYEEADVDLVFSTIQQKLLETRSKFKTSFREKPFKIER